MMISHLTMNLLDYSGLNCDFRAKVTIIMVEDVFLNLHATFVFQSVPKCCATATWSYFTIVD